MRAALRAGLVVVLVALAAPAAAFTRVGPAYVTTVPDGEMLYAEFGGRIEAIRYIGVNAPWIDHPSRGREPYSAVTREMNRRLVEGRWVYLYFAGDQRDTYGRLHAYVWRGDVFVNAMLIHAGWAVATNHGHYVDYFRSLEQGARSDTRGLWRYRDVLLYYRPQAGLDHETVAPGSGGRVFSAPAPFVPTYAPISPPAVAVPSGPANPTTTIITPPATVITPPAGLRMPGRGPGLR